MITAVDSNMLFDVFGADAIFGHVSADALRTSRDRGFYRSHFNHLSILDPNQSRA